MVSDIWKGEHVLQHSAPKIISSSVEKEKNICTMGIPLQTLDSGLLPNLVIRSRYRPVDQSMNKRKSFVFSLQHSNWFSRRINALLARNEPIKTAVAIVMHDFNSLKTMSFLHVADIAYFLIVVTEIIQYCSFNVTSETFLKT